MFGLNKTRLSEYLRRRGPGWKSTPWLPVDSRTSKQRALLQLLSLAYEQRLDSAALIVNLASEQRGIFRRRLFRLAARLRAGTPLVSALEQTPDVLSESDVLSIRFAIQSGTMAATYQSLLDLPSDYWSRMRVQIPDTIL